MKGENIFFALFVLRQNSRFGTIGALLDQSGFIPLS